MRFTGLALALGLVVAGLGSVPAAAQSNRAVDACSRTALQQAMLVMSVEGQFPQRDKRGVVVGSKVDMRVNALGKKKVVSCYYTDATQVAVIRPFQQGSGNAGDNAGGNGNTGGTASAGNLPSLRREAVRACQRSSQQQGLMLDNLVSQNDVFNRRGQISGSEVVINVFQGGRPAQVVCEFDYETRNTSLELRRATLR